MTDVDVEALQRLIRSLKDERDELRELLDGRFNHSPHQAPKYWRRAREAERERDGMRVERDKMQWAEMLTDQECAEGKHPDWWIDSEHNHPCPWCSIDELWATVARVEALADKWEASLAGTPPLKSGTRHYLKRLRKALAGDQP